MMMAVEVPSNHCMPSHIKGCFLKSTQDYGRLHLHYSLPSYKDTLADMDSTLTSQASDDRTSSIIDISQYNTHGLCANYTLRRHKYEAEANAGSHEARSDWIKHIGPVEQFGGCNPINGNFTAVVLPLCLPERIRIIAYIHECMSFPAEIFMNP
jgi:hypothetical protein